MAGELVTQDNEFQIRDLLIAATEKYQWETTPDWWGGATIRTNDTPYAAAHGVRGGRDLLSSKTVTGRLWVLADTSVELQDLLDALSAAWAPSDENIPFVAQQLGSKRRRYGRPRRLQVIPDDVIKGSVALVALEFEALDPYVYSDVEYSDTVGMPSAGGGVTLPITLPITFGASSGGSLAVTNEGTVAAPWTGRLDGPLTNPYIIHRGQQRALDFDANDGLDLGPSDFALLDSQTRSVLLNGVADRRLNLDLGSLWFDLDPGANDIGFDADAGTGTFTMIRRHAWL